MKLLQSPCKYAPLTVISAAFFAIGVVACSSSSTGDGSGDAGSGTGTDPADGGTSAASEAGRGDTDGSAPTCGDGIEDTAQAVGSTVDENDPAPVASGGTVADGTYELTSIIYYDVKDGGGHIIGSGGYDVSARQTMRVSGNVIDTAIGDPASTASPLVWQSATFATSGKNLDATMTCSSDGALDPTPSSTAYTASATKLTFIYPPEDMGGGLGMSGERVWTWTKK